jgi:hypothetical protein
MYQECRHIMPSGRKCHSPALRGQAYCYYHTNLRRHGRPPSTDNLTLSSIEDHRGIQIALSQVLSVLNSPYLDTRRAGLMLYGLQLAAQLAKHNSEFEHVRVVRTCDESTGVALAPEKTVCEPPLDCRKCPRMETCEDYEDPEEEEEEEEEDCEEEDLEEDGDDPAEEESGEDEAFAGNEAALIRKAMTLLKNSNAP